MEWNYFERVKHHIVNEISVSARLPACACHTVQIITFSSAFSIEFCRQIEKLKHLLCVPIYSCLIFRKCSRARRNKKKENKEKDTLAIAYEILKVCVRECVDQQICRKNMAHKTGMKELK